MLGPDFRKLWIGQSISFLGSQITQISLRQAVTPPEWQGRVNASIGFLLWAAAPVGALAGGYLAAAIGMKATLWIAASGVALSTLWALGSQIRVTRTLE